MAAVSAILGSVLGLLLALIGAMLLAPGLGGFFALWAGAGLAITAALIALARRKPAPFLRPAHA